MNTETIRLSQKQQGFVEQAIADGQFANADDTVRAALCLLEDRLEQLRSAEEELKRQLDQAADGGMSARTADEIFQSAIERGSKTPYLKREVSLPEHLVDFLESMLAEGRYADVSSVIESALRALREEIANRKYRHEALRTLLDDAVAKGLSKRSYDEIWRDGLRRHNIQC